MITFISGSFYTVFYFSKYNIKEYTTIFSVTHNFIIEIIDNIQFFVYSLCNSDAGIYEDLHAHK